MEKQTSGAFNRIALLASLSHRTGPDSRLMRFVREFELALIDPNLCEVVTTPSIARGLGRAGLLLRAKVLTVRPAHDGGLVDITAKVVDKELDVVIYFMDPRDPTTLFPEAAALKRECVEKAVFFLSTYMSAVEWASLIWHRHPDLRELIAPTDFWTAANQQRVALIAHDQCKVDMLDFALRKHRDLLASFGQRVATGTTGGQLSDPSRIDELVKALTRARQHAVDEDDTKAIDKLDKKLKVLASIRSKTKMLDVVPRLSGPLGGDVQIAQEVNAGFANACTKGTRPIHKVIFFEDVHSARPHEADIQLLERTCRLRGEYVVCLSDPKSADTWARAWLVDPKDETKGYVPKVPVTVLRALEAKYGSKLERPLRVVLDSTGSTAAETMENICTATAHYVAVLADKYWRVENKRRSPVRIAVPWGHTAAAIAKELARILDAHAPGVAEEDRPRVEVLALTGLVGTGEPAFEANVVAERFAAAFGVERSTVTALPAVAFVKSAFQHQSKAVAECLRRLADAQIVLLAGRPIERNDSQPGSEAPLLDALYQTAKARHAVGELCGIFIDDQGEEVDVQPYRRTGMDLATIRKIAADPRRRVVLAIGANPQWCRLAGAVLSSKQTISTLITDDQFARKLL